jgi:hypothetical protein
VGAVLAVPVSRFRLWDQAMLGKDPSVPTKVAHRSFFMGAG